MFSTSNYSPPCSRCGSKEKDHSGSHITCKQCGSALFDWHKINNQPKQFKLDVVVKKPHYKWSWKLNKAVRV